MTKSNTNELLARIADLQAELAKVKGDADERRRLLEFDRDMWRRIAIGLGPANARDFAGGELDDYTKKRAMVCLAELFRKLGEQ